MEKWFLCKHVGQEEIMPENANWMGEKANACKYLGARCEGYSTYVSPCNSESDKQGLAVVE